MKSAQRKRRRGPALTRCNCSCMGWPSSARWEGLPTAGCSTSCVRMWRYRSSSPARARSQRCGSSATRRTGSSFRSRKASIAGAASSSADCAQPWEQKRSRYNRWRMPCLLVLLTLAFPRVVLLALFFFTDYLARAFPETLWLVLGFIFLPVTTLAYAWIVNSHVPIAGPYLVAIIIAVVVDLGLVGSHRVRRG